MSEIVVRVRIELEETDPLVWRELDVPLSTTLAAMHDIIQVVMDWWDYHLYEFEIAGRIYGVPSPDDEIYERKVYQARALRLGTVLERGVREFLYVYDFGDNWQHRITVGEVRQGDAGVEYPRFIAGARRAPPEDVGSTSGFEEFLEAIADPEHEDHERMLEWYGKPFDPEDIDERRLHMIIDNIAARRRGPLKSHRGDRRKKLS
ncbi:plasmid pRiA4b ORF-3 family protein [Roseovarius sp. SYSU LYC5161]|uniref:plasmid pRiA4b ORF-3 family protein n=1 Tax=Roseovarius halophilus (ex Wu et al. 2025) TaxID=3376060 RepID=UPI0039995493